MTSNCAEEIYFGSLGYDMGYTLSLELLFVDADMHGAHDQCRLVC